MGRINGSAGKSSNGYREACCLGDSFVKWHNLWTGQENRPAFGVAIVRPRTLWPAICVSLAQHGSINDE